MQRILLFFSQFILSVLIVFPFVFVTEVKAQVSCPSSEMECPTLDSQGGCQSPCVKAEIRSGGPGGRGAAITAKCACVIPEEPESKSCGEPCSADSECPSDCSVCTPTGFHSTPVCASERWQPGDPPLNIRVRAQECTTKIVTSQTMVGPDMQYTYAPGIKTALGCIPYDPGPLVTWVFGLAIFMGGGIAFLIMGMGAFLFITSQGNPEQIQKGKEIIVSAGTGLLFIIFSIFLLRLIGVDILKIPGFT